MMGVATMAAAEMMAAETVEEMTAGTPSDLPPIEPFEERQYVILTHFIGDEDEMHFTSLNNVNLMAGAQESDQMEVSYYVENCRGRINKKKSKPVFVAPNQCDSR